MTQPSSSLINFLRDHYLATSIISIALGILLSYLGNIIEYKEVLVTVLTDQGETISKSCAIPKPCFVILHLFSNGLIPFGITLFITMFFVDKFNEVKDNQLKQELRDFQSGTAEDAVYSIFNHLFEESFLDVIKEDVLKCSLIRKEAEWDYDIKILSDNKLALKRTVTYNLQNLSSKTQNEPIRVVAFENDHVKLNIIDVKCRKKDGEAIKSILSDMTETHEGDVLKKSTTIPIEANSSILIIKEFEQIFNNSDYVYETQFTTNPLTDLKLNIDIPEGYSFSLSYDALSQTPEVRMDKEDKKKYVFKKAILKGQGIEFVIKKKATT